MKKNLKAAFDFGCFTDLRQISVMAIFSAISIVLGKFLAINFPGEVNRISFENLTIILSGVFFGAFGGSMVGLVADIVGSLLRGYDINPIITAGAFSIGFLSGLIWNILPDKHRILRIFLTIFIPHIVGSMIIKTIGLAAVYDFPLHLTIIVRVITYIVVGAAEIWIISVLTKNTGFMNQIKRIRR